MIIKVFIVFVPLHEHIKLFKVSPVHLVRVVLEFEDHLVLFNVGHRECLNKCALSPNEHGIALNDTETGGVSQGRSPDRYHAEGCFFRKVFQPYDDCYRRATVLSSYLRLMRPRQWAKNAFVFAPLIFARQLFEMHQALLALQAFLAFNAAASFVYAINDVVDAPLDRLHPEKRNRPVASGALTSQQALWFGGALFLVALGLTITLDVRFITVIVIYVVMNLFYTYRLKQVLLLDVFIIAAGFMLRVIGGAFAIRVNVSSWLVLCSLFISLFLGFGKRRAEILRIEDEDPERKRPVLSGYNVSFLDQMITITAAGAVISYALYTVAPRTVDTFGTEKLIYTTILVCYGIFRYLFLTYQSTKPENPTNLVTSDRVIFITGLLWIASCVLIIYQGGKFRLM